MEVEQTETNTSQGKEGEDPASKRTKDVVEDDDDSDKLICVDDDCDEMKMETSVHTEKADYKTMEQVEEPSPKSMFCWGNSDKGQLGLGAIDNHHISIPREMPFFRVS